MLKFLALAAAFMFAAPVDAYAQDVMSTATSKLGETFEAIKKIVFVLGGFGLVGLAVGAIFGAVKWKWFASVAIGLAVVAAASAVVSYATNDTSAMAAANVQDTLK